MQVSVTACGFLQLKGSRRQLDFCNLYGCVHGTRCDMHLHDAIDPPLKNKSHLNFCLCICRKKTAVFLAVCQTGSRVMDLASKASMFWFWCSAHFENSNKYQTHVPTLNYGCRNPILISVWYLPNKQISDYVGLHLKFSEIDTLIKIVRSAPAFLLRFQ